MKIGSFSRLLFAALLGSALAFGLAALGSNIASHAGMPLAIVTIAGVLMMPANLAMSLRGCSALGATGLSNLVPDAYAALAVVSREVTGLLASVNRLPGVERLGIGQSLRSPVAPVNTAGRDIVPAMTLPAAAEQTIGNRPFVLTKSRAFPFTWSGEDQRSADAGPGALTIQQQQIAQAFRAAIKELSADGYAAARIGGSRAYGTAGTTPFATNLGGPAQLAKILTDNGTPMGRKLVIDTTAGANLRTLLNNPLNANASLAGDLVRQGVLIDVNDFSIREEAAISTVTAGTMASATSTNAAFTVGQTVIPLATAGTGVVAAGDVITFANDTNKYVVASATFAGANPAAGDTITLAAPGLRVAQSAATRAITVGGNFTANLGFSEDAIVVGTRLPALPNTGDLAIMRETIIDPVTKIAFELAAYGGYRMVTFEVGLAWGWAVENPEHLAILLG